MNLGTPQLKFLAFGSLLVQFLLLCSTSIYVEGQKHVKSKGLGQHDVCMEYQMKLSILLVLHSICIYTSRSSSLAHKPFFGLHGYIAHYILHTTSTTSMLPTTFIVWAEKLFCYPSQKMTLHPILACVYMW